VGYLKREKHPLHENSDQPYIQSDTTTLDELFANANDAILAKHGSSVSHCYVNRSACKLSGYNFGELMNMEFKDLVHPEELDKIEARLEIRKKGVDLPCRYETRIITKNGEVVPVEVTDTVSLKGHNGFFISVLKDIRKEKHLENEMNKNMQKLKDKLAKNRSEWESLNMELVETHHAMSILAKNIESQKVELENKVSSTINSKVMPVIKKLLSEERIKRFWPEISVMAEHLNSITTKSDLHRNIIGVLTNTEMKIAGMVKNGMASKEIASVMFISLETVKAHRRNIRKKLEIHNTKLKLSEYLADVMG
jgi:PAS domain S-box-containing protein